MKKFIFVFLALAIIIFPSCGLTPPSPPRCADDGQGMQPINPEKITAEQRNAVPGNFQVKKRGPCYDQENSGQKQ